MIIKHSARKSASKFSNLLDYITKPLGVEERVVDSWSENFGADLGEDLELFSELVDISQDRKVTLKEKGKDMTYHMIISFTDDEASKLSGDDFKDIASKVQKSLGLEKHHSISAVHGDTMNPHIHMAVSLLNQEGSFKEPYMAYRTFQKVRGEIAKEYGFTLQDDKGKDNESKSNDVSVKMKVHNEQESFTDWLKSNVKEDLKTELDKKSSSWAKVHTLLMKKGVSLKKRGNGMVFSHNNKKLFVKSSSIDRSFSFGKLKSKLGEFEENKSKAKPDKEYSGKQADYKEGKKLYAKYEETLKNIRKLRAKERSEARAKFFNDKKLISAEIKAAKQTVLDNPKLDQKQRAGELKALTFKRAQMMEGVLADNQERLNKVKAEHKHKTWKDFLIQQAKNGDHSAISMLQMKGIMWKQDVGENQVYNEDYKLVGDTLRGLTVDVKPTGEVIYKTKKKAIIKDRGMRLIVGDKFDEDKLEAALKLAVSKFGKTLHLKGENSFKEAMIEKAKKMKLQVKFVDEAKTFKRYAKKSASNER